MRLLYYSSRLIYERVQLCIKYSSRYLYRNFYPSAAVYVGTLAVYGVQQVRCLFENDKKKKTRFDMRKKNRNGVKARHNNAEYYVRI